MKKKGLFAALPIMLILSVCSIIGLCVYSLNLNKDCVIISHESGIYDENILFSVTSLQPGKILYTLNGEIPTIEGENVIEYTEPILLECKEDTGTYSFKICSFFEDGTSSEVYQRDFIFDANAEERFTTTYVVSIVGDERKLFSEEEGIFVRGNQYYEYLEQNPNANLLDEIIPANYNEDIEVPVHMAMFSNSGEKILDQNCGIKIYGNFTRQHNQKSFRLYARYTYDERNEFCYPLFDNMISQNGNAQIEKWQRLSFHNSGNDNSYGFVRSALMGDLANQAGYPDVLVSESVTVYINGKYQGVYWLQNTFDDKYFKEKYGDYSGEMVVCEGTLSEMYLENAETDIERTHCESYNQFCEWIGTADLSKEENWDRVCNTIDVENFAQYFSLEYYTTNIDWPDNNVKIYRYEGDEMNGETFRENTVFDGKWRFLLFDTDYSLGLKTFEFYGYDASGYRLASFLSTDENTVLFRSLCQREEFVELFISNVLTMMNTVFEQQNVSDALYGLNVKRHNELIYMLEKSGLMQGSIWEPWGVGNGGIAKAEEEWAEIVLYAKDRPGYVISELQSVWDCGMQVPIRILTREGDMFIKNISVGQEFEGVWLANVPLQLSCDVENGYVVEGFMVNSDYVEGEELYLSEEQLIQYKDGLEVYPVLEKNEIESIEIVEYKIDGPEDYIILKNNGSVDVQLDDYAITDDLSDISKGSLPAIELNAGECFWIYGEKYSDTMERESFQVPFSWNDTEQVYLYHKQNGLVYE